MTSQRRKTGRKKNRPEVGPSREPHELSDKMGCEPEYMDYEQEQMDYDQGTSVPDTQGDEVPWKSLMRELLNNREMIEEVRAED
ncbi:hypothetical protein LWI28_020427 [Acer negundo]|uniref:Uncharacterized protein n=1 Tax=Acer negundo TaxID=4023 RepID=A0AAD5NSL1_ACENE|nr:hypothetical protein LWI28_020427 [Acer negundo]